MDPTTDNGYLKQDVKAMASMFPLKFFCLLIAGVLYSPPQHVLGNLTPLGSGGVLRLDRQGQPLQVAQPPLPQPHAPVPPPGPLGPPTFQQPSFGFYAASPEGPGTTQSFYGYPVWLWSFLCSEVVSREIQIFSWMNTNYFEHMPYVCPWQPYGAAKLEYTWYM